MSKAKHTELPWRLTIQETTGHIYIEIDEEQKNRSLGELTNTRRTIASIENANEMDGHYIVKACNNYPEMVELLRDIGDMLNKCGYGGSNTAIEKKHEKRIRALLAGLEE